MGQGKKKLDDSETDETDDEDVGMSAAPVLSQISSSAIVPEWIQNKIRKRVQNKVILTSLCLPKDTGVDTFADNKMNTNKSALSTTIQCGNAILNVTRITLNICYSQLRSADAKRLREASANIGATITSTIDALTTTHLVSPSQISTAKSICAWMYQIPVVSISFVDALAERTCITDPMPMEDDHVPPGSLPIDDGIKKSLDDDPTLPQRCFRGYKVLSLEDSDGEMLCRGAGATVIKLYADEKENGQTNSTFWKEDTWWERLEEIQKEDRLVVVWLACSKKKLKRGQDFLTKLMKKQEKLGDDDDDAEFRIYSTNQSKVAKAITSLTVLEDIKGEELNPILASSSSEIQNDTVETDLLTAIKGGIDNSVDSNGDDNYNTNDKPNSIPCSDADNKEQTIQEVQTNSQHKKILPSQQSGTAGWMISSQMDRGNKSLLHEEVVTAMDDGEEVSQHEPEGHVSVKALNKIFRKNKLKVTEGGWLVAAPQGRKRARYRRPAAELASYGEGPLSDPAQTEHCNSLIILQEENVQNPISLLSRNVKNFKRFQKNSVITGARMHSLSQIRLRSVLPKESERQRQLADSEQELKREQHAADSLFSGGNDKSRRGKSNIRNYFQASPKRGTGRRRRA